MHLPSFGWQPIILTVHERFYEEALDRNLETLLPKDLRVEKVGAYKVTKPRIIGDIGLRGFFQLYRRAKEIVNEEKVDFLYVPIPSFYVSLLGRWLHLSTGIPYGIDYIDPWVHQFKGSERMFSRQWWSTRISTWLEPVAVKDAVLITGVAEGYYQGVKDRNPHLSKEAVFAAMPYGGEKSDHSRLRAMAIAPYLFARKHGKYQLVYAGAMLPNAFVVLEAVFESIRENRSQFQDIEFHFIGTGKSPNDPHGYNIKAIAERYDLWGTVVFEYPRRIPYLDVLVHLEASDAVFVLGSTEAHYTPSKVYQGVLSGKPVFAVLHQASSAADVLVKSRSGFVLAFNGEHEVHKVRQLFSQNLSQFKDWGKRFNPGSVDLEEFERYSASSVTRTLAQALDAALEKQTGNSK